MYQQLKRCPITGAADLEPLRGYEAHFLVRSRSSGFVFCERIPTESELKAAYEGYTRTETAYPLTLKRFNELLEEFEEGRKPGRILDIGCGSGHFLSQALSRGWTAYGTEYTDDAVKVCQTKGIETLKGRLELSMFGDTIFDVITYMEVIEHQIDPLTEMKKAHRLLRPGGLIYFTVPNFNALARFILRDKYNILTFPEHLGHYTPKTIDLLMTRAGFTRKQLFTQGISLTRIRNSLRSEGLPSGVGNATEILRTNQDDRQIDENVRNAIERYRFLDIAKRSINGLLNLFGVGNSLRGIYVKRS